MNTEKAVFKQRVHLKGAMHVVHVLAYIIILENVHLIKHKLITQDTDIVYWYTYTS